MSLELYRKKRNFKVSREPKGKKKPPTSKPIFVIQEHHARRLHFDLRLEARGVLKSWAVTKEPSAETDIRRLAIETEDHPKDYATFEGEIPKGEYGAGTVRIWDQGTFDPAGPVEDEMEAGKIEVIFKGKKLKGRYALIRINGEGPRSQWLFFKMRPKTVKLKIPAH